MVKILFVCMGNICRSPTAQGVFEQILENEGLTERVQVDSAGTHAYHVGEAPDDRAMQSAMRRGIDISHQRARKVRRQDFEEFHYLIAMDEDNRYHLEQICPSSHRHKISLFLEHAPEEDVREVPDPYFGGHDGFERVLDLVEAAGRGLLESIKSAHLR
jgi:protein-tyrosine phosphatase